jgi:hypothetical protein
MRSLSVLFLLAFILMGCPSWPTAPDSDDVIKASLDEPFTLAIDQTAVINDALQLRFEAVPEDSRCPSDVDCVWAGRALVQLHALIGAQRGGPVFELNTSDPDAQVYTYGGYRIQLLTLDPYPSTRHPIDPDDYRAQLQVESVR